MRPNPYDELPYPSIPIAWTAPERLSLASMLHGGPRAPTARYRVLELGCGDGSNLLPLAYYRSDSTFVGVDGAGDAIATANARRQELDLANLQFIHSDLMTLDGQVDGPFDFILAHGVFSWVPDGVRDQLLAICARSLRPRGLLYLNYNSKPGWNVRGLVREFLLAQTAATYGLRARAELAQQASAKMAASLGAAVEHPYTRLMEREFRFVCENHPAYVAHEFLAADNHAYWRSEFLTLARRFGLEHVADADFNYSSGRIPEGLGEKISAAELVGQSIADTVDLLSYRQLHSPILTTGPWTSQPISMAEIADLFLASCLKPMRRTESGPGGFQHPSGLEVEAKGKAMRAALERLEPLWPRGLRVGELFRDCRPVADDLMLLHRHGVVELRSVEYTGAIPAREPLNSCELRWRHLQVTTPYHLQEHVAAP